MNTSRKFLYLKIAGIFAIVTTLVFAAMTFNPATQPAIVIGPYAFDAGNLLDGQARAFRPWFENGSWQGDLIEYNVDEFGIRTTDADVGSNPPTATGTNWMARATFADKEAGVSDYWQESNGSDSKRNIFTVNSDSGSQVDFLWDNLSALQQSALDQATVDAGLTLSYSSNILNFVRGDRSEDKSNTGGTLRLRFSLLGDIINSNPVYIGKPEEAFIIEGFPTFKFDNLLREARVAVGANDGMLHVFDAADGSEVYAYIPSMLLGKLGKLAAIPYRHTYYVDGQLSYASAIIDAAWKSILTGGLGAGGKGLFILDVTDPDPTDDKVLYEKTGNDFGYIYGKPRLGRNADGIWNVYIGNGYDSTNGVAKLLIISLEDGSVTTISTGIAGGLSAPAIVSGPDRVVDFVYAGDSNGDMWKFDIANNTATRIYDGIPDQPIMSAPVIGAHPNGGFMVFFGTGNMTSLTDVADTSYPTQAIYGIWDSPIGSTIVQQYLRETQATFSTDDGNGNITTNTTDVRYVTDSAGNPANATVDYVCAANDATCAMGWKAELPNTGERVLATPSLRAGRVSVVTTNPVGTDGEPDLGGDSWLMSLFYLTGGDGNDVTFNLSGDAVLNADDRFTVSSVSVPPVGVSLGDGIISQPAIVRVADGIDMVFINGLRLPIPQVFEGGPFLSGHIDVETDSPNAKPLPGGSVAPNNLSKHSDDYNIQTSDGLGRGVDGHVHAYDTIHNITWIDFFELEPRRGAGNLAALPVPASGDSCPSGSTGVFDNSDPPVLQGCVETVEAELNRAYDTYGAPETSPVEAPTLAAEVYGLGANTPLLSSQRFIVTLANADLTPGGKLQIGCRVWDVEEYQDMLTAQLEATPTPHPAALDDCPANDDCPNAIHSPFINNSLVFTLDSIAEGKYVDSAGEAHDDGGDCSALDEDEGLSQTPTLRLGFNQRSILDGGIHGTRSQCVLGLHDWREKVCYPDADVLAQAETALAAGLPKPHPVTLYKNCDGIPATPAIDYIRDPALNLHLTESLEGDIGKWRTRNGAMTLQLLKVDNANSDQRFNLQNKDYLPQTSKGIKVTRFGGTYAQMFTTTRKSGGLTYPDAGDAGNLDTGESAWPESGLLYESTLYWHYSDLADKLRRDDPASIPCYGDANYNSALVQELGGLTEERYLALIASLGDETDNNSLISQYSALLDALAAAFASGDQDQINQALLDLGNLLDANQALYDFAQYRDYAPGHIPEQHLLDIDKNQTDGGGDYDGGNSADDGTPVDVDDLEGFGMGGGGGNGGSGGGLSGNDVIDGLRIWIDPRD
ncbi:MAG: PilC/PilY family type IV pilus protein [Pseudomonadota bacterium]